MQHPVVLRSGERVEVSVVRAAAKIFDRHGLASTKEFAADACHSSRAVIHSQTTRAFNRARQSQYFLIPLVPAGGKTPRAAMKINREKNFRHLPLPRLTLTRQQHSCISIIRGRQANLESYSSWTHSRRTS